MSDETGSIGTSVISFPILVDEVTNRFHVKLSSEVFDYVQFLFFVYPERSNFFLASEIVKFRNSHLLEFEGLLKLSIRDLDVFCRTILRWKDEMDQWQGPETQNPYEREFDKSFHARLENDISSISKILSPILIDQGSFYESVER